MKPIKEKSMRWKIHQDIGIENEQIQSFSITLNPEYCGWNTDSGYEGYGLPKELAEWICNILNQSEETCPYEMDKYGTWKKK
jgi:hypothetical protein